MFPVEASIPYFFYLFLFVVFSFYREIRSKSDINNILVINLIIIFFLFNGEYSDWRVYRLYVDSCNSIGCTYFEPLYDLLTFIASRTLGYDLIKLFSLVLLYVSFKRIQSLRLSNVEYFIITISILLVFLPLYYGAIRQSIAFSFLLTSFINFYKNKNFFASIWLIGSIGFHYSSALILIAFLSVLILWKLSNQRLMKFFFLLSVGAALFLLLMNQFGYLLNVLDSFNPGTQNATYDPIKVTILVFERVLIIILCFILLYHTRDLPALVLFTLFSLTGAIFYLAVFQFSLNTAGRVTSFFRLADILVIYYSARLFLNGFRQIVFNRINGIALYGTGLFILIKFYFTIFSVGFFR